MFFKNVLKPQTTISDFQATLPYLCSASLSPGRGGLGGATSSSDMSVKLSVGVTMGVVLLRIAFSRSVRGFSHTLRKREALLKCLYAKMINPNRPLRLYLSVLVTGGAGLLGDVGDGCSCFSIVSFTSSCYKRTHSGYKYASVALTLSQTHISSPHLHTIQHAFDHRGDGCHSVLVVEVDALQHHLVGPTNEIRQTLIDAVMTGGHCRAAVRERENNGEELHASCKAFMYHCI